MPGDVGSGADEPEQRRGAKAFVREVAIVLTLSLVIASLVRVLLAQAFLIPSGSMEDTLLVGDRVLVSKMSYRFGEIERGDVVVFSDPGEWLPPSEADNGGIGGAVESFFEFVGVLPDDSEGHLIKRVIAIGGDTVECCDDAGRLTVNGVSIEESEYLYPGDEPSLTEFSETVPEGELWVMGDHRSHSGDSRVHGTVSEDEVVGRAVSVVWPFSRWDWLSRGDQFDDVPEP